MLKIGNLEIHNPIFLAPMAGVTDHPFRVLCREHGAGVVYTEFVSADGIVRENLKTLDLMKFSENERPIGIQIFGNDPQTVGQSAKILNDKFNPDIIDINYGCPVPKVTKRGAGSGAMKDLCKMEDITQAVIEAVPNKPVTVKMRAGLDSNRIVSTEAAIRLEKIGVSAITLHPRTTKQQFSGRSKWSYIKEMKDEIDIPVIGNGDIVTAEDYFRMIEETGCDAAMIGRAALGNPWIFESIKAMINGIEYKEPSLLDRAKLCKKHFFLLREDKHEKVCVNLSKKHFSWYLKGFPGASTWRKKIVRSETSLEIENHLNKLVDSYK